MLNSKQSNNIKKCEKKTFGLSIKKETNAILFHPLSASISQDHNFVQLTYIFLAVYPSRSPIRVFHGAVHPFCGYPMSCWLKTHLAAPQLSSGFEFFFVGGWQLAAVSHV